MSLTKDNMSWWLMFLLVLHLSISARSQKGDDNEVMGERTSFACQGATLHLNCADENNVIKVTRANYGRFSIALCNTEGTTDWSVNCYTPKAKSVIANTCNNLAECKMSSSDFDFGPNPCPDTERYLEAHYVCVRKVSNTSDKAPPWLKDSLDDSKGGSSMNRRRKPIRRVPITAPPSTTANFYDMTTAGFSTKEPAVTALPPISVDRSTKVNLISDKGSKFVDDTVVSAPVFYEENKRGDTSTEASGTKKTAAIQINQQKDVVQPMCQTKRFRGVLWRQIPVGTANMQPCPYSSGVATWDCVYQIEGSTWKDHWPDMSQCRSHEWPPVELSDPALLEKVIVTSTNLYGGDILPILNLVGRMTKNLRSQKQAESLYRILSGLLDPRFLAMWHDLPASLRRSTLGRFMDVTENLAAALGGPTLESEETGDPEKKSRAIVVTPNIFMTLKAFHKEEDEDVNNNRMSMRHRAAHIVFPARFSFNANQLQGSEEEFSQRTSESALQEEEEVGAAASSTVSIHLPLLEGTEEQQQISYAVFISYLQLDHIMGADFGQHPASQKTGASSSRIISISAASSKGQLVPAKEAQVRIQLPEESVSELSCHPWQQEPNNEVCHVARWRNGTAQCVCDALGSYSLNVTDNDALVRQNDDLTPAVIRDHGLFTAKNDLQGVTAMVVVVAVSASLLVATLLATALLVIYCRRVKIRDKKWEEESRPWYRKSSPPSTSSSQQHGDTDRGSIQTSTTLTSSRNLQQLAKASQPDANSQVFGALAHSNASIISTSEPRHHYESSPHLLLSSLSTMGRIQDDNDNQGNQESKPTTPWKKLLTKLKPNPVHHPRRHLTLGRSCYSGLNSEDTLRLQTHRHLFQFAGVSNNYMTAGDRGGSSHHHNNHHHHHQLHHQHNDGASSVQHLHQATATKNGRIMPFIGLNAATKEYQWSDPHLLLQQRVIETPPPPTDFMMASSSNNGGLHSSNMPTSRGQWSAANHNTEGIYHLPLDVTMTPPPLGSSICRPRGHNNRLYESGSSATNWRSFHPATPPPNGEGGRRRKPADSSNHVVVEGTPAEDLWLLQNEFELPGTQQLNNTTAFRNGEDFAAAGNNVRKARSVSSSHLDMDDNVVVQETQPQQNIYMEVDTDALEMQDDEEQQSEQNLHHNGWWNERRTRHGKSRKQPANRSECDRSSTEEDYDAEEETSDDEERHMHEQYIVSQC